MERFKNGDRVCFLGDSITAQNRYVAHITDYYKTNFPNEDVKIFNCGISGGMASVLLKYFDEDVTPHKPTHIFIMLGVNDSRHFLLDLKRSDERYETLLAYYEEYKENLTALCEKSEKTGAKVTLITPVPYAEYQECDTHANKGGFALLLGYANFVKNLAAKKGLPLIDTHTFMTRHMQEEVLYDSDRIHPNDKGQYFIAKCILENMGLDVGEFKAIPEYLEEWRGAVFTYRRLYAVEHMILGNADRTTEEKLDFVKKYLDGKEYIVKERSDSLNTLFKALAELYLEMKPCQKEFFFEIDALFDKIIAK